MSPDAHSAPKKEKSIITTPKIQLIAETNALIKASLSRGRRCARVESARSPQSLQHRRGRAIRVCQTRTARPGGRIDGRAVRLPAIPEYLLDVTKLQDFGN